MEKKKKEMCYSLPDNFNLAILGYTSPDNVCTQKFDGIYFARQYVHAEMWVFVTGEYGYCKLNLMHVQSEF